VTQLGKVVVHEIGDGGSVRDDTELHGSLVHGDPELQASQLGREELDPGRAPALVGEHPGSADNRILVGSGNLRQGTRRSLERSAFGTCGALNTRDPRLERLGRLASPRGT
jgi:hypothetical protein